MRNLVLDIRQSKWPFALIALGCLPLLWAALRHFDGMQWFGFLLLPFILNVDKNQRGNGLFLWLALLFAVLYLLLGQYYWTFAAALAIIYHLIDTRFGKLNSIAVYTIIFYLPLTRSFFTLFGFYIRMEITKWAAWFLSVFNQSVTHVDSSIWVDGAAFTVDAGCMGLRLVITGFIFTLLLVQQLSKRVGKGPTRKVLSIVLLLSFALVVLANFVRILLTIQFRSPADSWSHEAIGLITFFLFHLVPMFLMVKWLVGRTANRLETVGSNQNRKPKHDVLWIGLAVILMLVKLITFSDYERYEQVNLSSNLPGFELTKAKDGVHRYANSHAVLLVKPMFPLSFSNHHPMLCWRGDGFEVVGEVRGQLGETSCYRAYLKKPDQQLATGWWFMNENGDSTTSEWVWRWNAIAKGQQYFLVNVAAINEPDLLFAAVQTENGKLAFVNQ